MAIDGGAATFGDYRRQLIKRECGSSRHNHLLDKHVSSAKSDDEAAAWLKTLAR
jgi:hypothetical protein